MDPMGYSPVFMRELRSRIRRPWLFWLLFGYVALVYSSGVLLLYRSSSVPGDSALDPFNRAQQSGLVAALIIYAVQFVMISLLTPLLTCASIASERQKFQLVFTLLTPMSSAQIVAGKVGVTLFFIGLLLISTMPLTAVSSLFGGFNPLDLLAGYLVLISYALFTTSLGLYFSARQTDTARAAAFTYLGIVLAPILFPWVLVPAAGLYSLLVKHDAVLYQHLVTGLPTPVMAAPVFIIFGLGARWCYQETVLLLDIERRRWGTFAPPLPLSEPSEVITPRADPIARRW